jgi:hypothetical protein
MQVRARHAAFEVTTRIEPTDAPTYSAVLLAAAVPAVRAARVDPAVALREP